MIVLKNKARDVSSRVFMMTLLVHLLTNVIMNLSLPWIAGPYMLLNFLWQCPHKSRNTAEPILLLEKPGHRKISSFPATATEHEGFYSHWKTKSLPFKTQFQMHASPMHFSSSKHQHVCLNFIQSGDRNSSENCKTFSGYKYVCPFGVPISHCHYVHIFLFLLIHSKQFFSFLGLYNEIRAVI